MRWMHLSDIHFGYTNASVDTMRKKLLEKARGLEQVDCLFITGDLRYGKNAPSEYPQETLDFLLDLRAALNITPNDVYIVPGNHDLERGQVLTSVIEGVLNQYSTPNGRIEQDALDYISSRRNAYKKLYQKVCGRDTPNWHYCETRNDFNIICLNTAILCGQDGEDGNLIIGSELLNQLAETVDKSKPSIVLAHHDFDSLRTEEQQKLEITLKELGATLYLCGHKHTALCRQQNTYRTDKGLRVFLCGTNMDQAPHMSQTDMDFFIGQTEDGHSGWIEAYKWYPRTSLWLTDNEFSSIQNEATDGKIYFPKEIRPNAQNGLRKDVLEKYLTYIKSQCGEIELNGLPINEQEVSHRFALRRLFVPLHFSYHDPLAKPDLDQSDLDANPIDPIPQQGSFRKFLLSDPGGGKSTLLKWIASVYCFPEEYRDIETHLPNRELFPVWLRCRDIPEGSRPTIWKMIQEIASQGEWLPHDSSSADFTALVAKSIADDKMLLLIDGLDEIGSEADRDHFIDQLRSFADLYPSVSILISSRPTGLSLVIKRKFTDFQYLNLDPLTSDDIKNLCLKWNQVVRGDTPEVRQEAAILSKRIVGNERIFRLASNPMLLTTLLLVERRVGRLPTKRVELYEEAIQVLLETWNSRGHVQHHIDLDEARYQLSYIAYHMMTRHTNKKSQIARITRSELLSLLQNARRELAELISGTETPSQFIQNIEHRSALLIQKGYEENSLGEREAVYEFQHLTFQEYLAAYAVTHACYPGATENDDLISTISPHLTNPNMREVIPLIAVRLPRFYPSRLVDDMLRQLDSPTLSIDHQDQLRNILLQLIADELALPSEKIDQILKKCFVIYYSYNDRGVLKQILEGKYSDHLYSRFKMMDLEMNEGFDYHTCVLDILSKKIENPIQYYLAHCEDEDARVRANSISIISCPIAFDIMSEFPEEMAELPSFHKAELYKHLGNENPIIQHAALWGLQDCSLVDSLNDWNQYINGFVRFVNQFAQCHCVYDADYLPSTNTHFEIMFQLTDKGFENIVSAVTNMPTNIDFAYGRLVMLSLIGVIACAKNHDINLLLQTLRNARTKFSNIEKYSNYIAYQADIKMHQLLNTMVLNADCENSKKAIIREHILKVDMEWISLESVQSVYVSSYCDYSLDNPLSFDKTDYVDDILGEKLIQDITSHIQSRLEELGNT